MSGNRSFAVVFLVAAMAFSSCAPRPDPESGPHCVVNRERTIVALLDPRGGLLWRKRFPAGIEKDPVVEDLDGDGFFEVLVLPGRGGRRFDARHPAYLECYGEDGALRWSFAIDSETHPMPYRRRGRLDEGPPFLLFPVFGAVPDGMIVTDLDGDSSKEIVLPVGAAGAFNPSMVIVLDANSTERGVFWNPGLIIDTLVCPSPTGRGKAIAILSFNSHWTSPEEKARNVYYPAIFMLDGTAFAKAEERFVCESPRINEKTLAACCLWYTLLPLPREPVEGIEASLHAGADEQTGQVLLNVTTRVGFKIDLNMQGRIVGLDLDPRARRQLEEDGTVHDESDVEALLASSLKSARFFSNMGEE